MLLLLKLRGGSNVTPRIRGLRSSGRGELFRCTSGLSCTSPFQEVKRVTVYLRAERTRTFSPAHWWTLAIWSVRERDICVKSAGDRVSKIIGIGAGEVNALGLGGNKEFEHDKRGDARALRHSGPDEVF